MIFSFHQKNYGRILFMVTFLMLCISLMYIFTKKPFSDGPDLCELWKERIQVDNNNYRNVTKEWWEWACLIEKEWDKGMEYVCKDERLVGNYHICFDPPHQPKAPCLVYSFGIDNDFRFDDEMGRLGCNVYSFDPSMGETSHQRSERVKFLNIGLATKDSDDFMPLIDHYTIQSKTAWKIRKFSSIRKMLGHENTPIDILKIDIESYEWAVMRQIVEEGLIDTVRQLTLEWHIFPNEPMRTEFSNMFDTYMQLKKRGFRQFYSSEYDRHHNVWYFNSQNDNSLVNVLFDEKSKKNQQTV